MNNLIFGNLNILNFSLLNERYLLISLLFGFIFFFIVLIYNYFFIKYKTNKQKKLEKLHLINKYLNLINSLIIEDKEFFTKLNEYLRLFLSESNIFNNAMNMTKNELISFNDNKYNIEELLINFELFEFSNSNKINKKSTAQILKQEVLTLISKYNEI